MIVLEHLIGEMKTRSEYKDRSLCNLVNFYQTRTWCDGNCSACKLSNPITVLEYLNEEYQEPIEMSQFEYDLLINCTQINSYDQHDKLYDYWIIEGMKDKGYFQNVDLDMTLKKVIERAVIVNDRKRN